MTLAVSPHAWGEPPQPSFEAVSASLERSQVRGRTARGACPLCGSGDGAWVRDQGEGELRVGCFACDDWQGLREVLGLSRTPRRVHSILRAPRVRSPDAAPDMVAEADRLDAVYRVLLRHLPMSADQRRNVLGRDRGLSLELRQRIAPLVGPLPADPGAWRTAHDRIGSELTTVANYEFLERVPELAARPARTLAILHTRRAAQYFEPWTDEQGRIVALRAYMGRRADPKYRTTGGRWGPLVHFAFGVPRGEAGHVPWVFTEGWMKAEILAHHLGAVGVAFAGVGQKSAWDRGIAAYQRLASDAPAYVAFDAEAWTTRPETALLTLQFARRLLEATGRCPGFAVWPAQTRPDGKVEPKGIDDAIAAGLPVQLVDRSAFGAYLGPALAAWEAQRAA